MSTPLPPFGIRGLCSPDKPFSILQLSENEYDVTVKSCSDTTLTWLDEDDGETITVGTGCELRERLCDPVSKTAPLIRFLNDKTERFEDRYVHLFDISRSQTTLNIWREHEARWSKSQNTFTESQGPSEDTVADKADAPISAVEPSPLNVSVGTSTIHTSVSLPSQAPVSSRPDALPEILDGLAIIFQNTSNILNKIAQKTRETNTSPIEDVLSGMAGVLGQTGALGLSLLEKLDQITTEHNVVNSSATHHDSVLPTSLTEKPDTPTVEAIADQEPQNLSFTEKGDVDMSLSTEGQIVDKEPQTQGSPGSSTTAQHRIEQDNILLKSIPIEVLRSHVQGRENFSTYQHLRQEPVNWTHLSTRHLKRELISREKHACLSKASVRRPFSHVLQSSLLDHDAEDADFTARYPPLTTLRRAKTVGSLHDNLMTEQLSSESNLDPQISRPSPQVFDAETQRRKDFARSCFPTHCSPAMISKFEPKKVPTPTQIEDDVEIAQPHDVDCNSLQRDNTEVQAMEVTLPFDPRQSSIETDPAGKATAEHTHKPLPGAWPDVVSENAPLLAPSTAESSGAFFNRMIDELHQSDETDGFLADSRANSVGLLRHRSLASHTAEPKHSDELHRSRTVSVTNPAARLNRPFDSTFPVLPPVEAKSEAAIQSKQSTPGPVRSLHRSSSDRWPRSLYEPYRPFSSHRSFSPVWEDHLKQPDVSPPSEPRDPFSHPFDLVTIYASGFSPGSTEHDVTAIIQEHCKDKWGRNCLQECRILSTEPIVTVKLVLNDTLVADQLIAIFDRLTLGGRILQFGRSHLLVEHAAREHHRHKRHQDGFRGPSRMRSLPTFAASARPRPHIYTASQPQMIFDGAVTGTVPPTTRPLISTRPELHDSIDACEAQLRTMGYGASDPAMESRLHVYAAAACGSVEEAIEMIEEDKNAHQAAANAREKVDVMNASMESGNRFEHRPWS